MLSFKAGPDLALTALSKKDSPTSSNGNTTNNFNSFIRHSNPNIETRTQQKLWLQRESSLLDLSMLNSSNPQIRREFERISREYLNARRFSNPIIEAVKRNSIDNKSSNGDVVGKLKTLKSDKIQNQLLKLWFVNESPADNQNNNYSSQVYEQQQQQQQQQQSQRYPNQTQLRVANREPTTDFFPLNNSGRSPAAPTTRAVDRANNSSENKRIDLSAARLQEVEQLQKLA
jgi:hypothetical protein